ARARRARLAAARALADDRGAAARRLAERGVALHVAVRAARPVRPAAGDPAASPAGGPLRAAVELVHAARRQLARLIQALRHPLSADDVGLVRGRSSAVALLLNGRGCCEDR